MQEQIRTLVFGLKLGVWLFPSYFLLDYFVYPDYKYWLLLIRVVVTVFLAAVLFFMPRIKPKQIFAVTLGSLWVVSFSVSLMCFITGDGFASPYYVGLLQVIIGTTLFFDLTPSQYGGTMLGIVGQHFVMQALIPWKIEDLLTNLLALGVFSLVAVLVHNLIYGLVIENKELKGFLPICANCKKIRDDEGYWHQVEVYMHNRTGVDFSHGICPECMRTLYPEFVEEEMTG